MNRTQIEWLKKHINPSTENPVYQEWIRAGKPEQFRMYVIDRAETV